MTRAELLAYASSLFAALAKTANVPLDDSAAGLAYQLDAVIDATTGDSDNSAGQQALIEYHALRKFRFVLAASADVNSTGIRKGKSQIFEQVDTLIADASSRSAAAGYPVATTGEYGLTAINLDYLEPEATA